MDRVEQAARVYLDRQDRVAHPTGRFDKARRWYPDTAEECECCARIRRPSRHWPWSLLTHCRTAVHVAHLYGVSVSALRAAARRLRQSAA